MDENSRLATSGTCCYHDTTRLLVLQDFFLAVRKFTKDLFVFRRCHISLDVFHTLPLEVFGNESLVIHQEIILHILQGFLIVLHHQVGVFAHDMNLLHFLLVKFIEHTIFFLLVPQSVVLQTLDVHGIVKHQKSAFEFQGTDL